MEHSDGRMSHHEKEQILLHADPPLPSRLVTCEFLDRGDIHILCQCTSITGEVLKEFCFDLAIPFFLATSIMEEKLARELGTVEGQIQLISTDGLLLKNFPNERIADVVPSPVRGSTSSSRNSLVSS